MRPVVATWICLRRNRNLDKFIIDLLSTNIKANMIMFLLDCAADISETTLNLNAWCDDRFIVVVPDKSSITDSYALIKILAKKVRYS